MRLLKEAYQLQCKRHKWNDDGDGDGGDGCGGGRYNQSVGQILKRDEQSKGKKCDGSGKDLYGALAIFPHIVFVCDGMR